MILLIHHIIEDQIRLDHHLVVDLLEEVPILEDLKVVEEPLVAVEPAEVFKENK